MDSQQSYNDKHQNCSLPNIFSELLELYGSQNLPFSQSSSGGNCISIDDDHVLDQGVRLEQEKIKSSSEGNIGFVFSCTSSSNESLAPRSSKQRIKWTEDLHGKFVECVNRLGGAEKATPKKILKLMNTNVLTIFHVKSHLQKYRTSKDIADHTKEKSEYRNGTHLDIKSGMQIKEALEHVNRSLHEQLEIQHNLQLLIEEQGKQLKMMLYQQQKTNKNLFMNSRQITLSDSHTQNVPCFNCLSEDHFSLKECSGSSCWKLNEF